MRVLDVGCGIGEPARRIASRIDCEIVGLNIGCGQVRQGRELIARAGLAARVDIRHGNALHMLLPDGGFDAAICLEAAGDICVRAADKPRLLAELRRVLRPGGQVGFSDLVFDPATDRGRGPGAARDSAQHAADVPPGRASVSTDPGRQPRAAPPALPRQGSSHGLNVHVVGVVVILAGDVGLLLSLLVRGPLSPPRLSLRIRPGSPDEPTGPRSRRLRPRTSRPS